VHAGAGVGVGFLSECLSLLQSLSPTKGLR
jgi:hypothetical protein